MSTLDNINYILLKKEDERGYKPVAPWQRGNAGEAADGNVTTTEPIARATRKSAGLPVDNNPHDHTGTEAGVDAARKNAGEVHGGGDDISTNGTERPHYSIAELIKLYHPYNEERMKEEEERQKKKQKRDAMFAAIGDGLNAFHQAYAYSRGIKPMTENKSQSKEVRDRYEKMFLDYDTKELAYLRDKMNARKMDEAAKKSKAQDDYNAAALEVRKGELQARKDKIALDTFNSTWKKDIAEGTLDVKKRQQEIDELYKRGRISEMARNAASRELQAQAAMLRAQNGGKTKIDSRGRTTTTTGEGGGLGWGSDDNSNQETDW